MSLTGALSSAVSALNAQSQSLAMIADNISNADTVGYKTTSAMFEDMVTASSSLTSYSSGGVSVSVSGTFEVYVTDPAAAGFS